MSLCGCVGKPAPPATRSSFMTRSVRNCTCFGSKYSAKENVNRVSSQPLSAWPRSLLLRIAIILHLPGSLTRRQGNYTCYNDYCQEECFGSLTSFSSCP